MKNLTISREANNVLFLFFSSFFFFVKSFAFLGENFLFSLEEKIQSPYFLRSFPTTNKQISFNFILYIQFNSIVRRAEKLIKRTKQKREIRIRIETNIAA